MIITAASFIKDALVQLPGATEDLIQHQIEAVLREFCEDGWAWPYACSSVDITHSNAGRVYLDPLPNDTRVGYIHSVRFSENVPPLRQLTSPPRYLGKPARPRYFMLEEPGTLLLYPAPDKDYLESLSVDLTVIPIDADTVLPDFFWTHHRDAVLSGVLGRMMVMPSKPWSSAPTGIMNQRRFRNFVKRSRATSGQRWGMDVQNWMFPYFAGNNTG